MDINAFQNEEQSMLYLLITRYFTIHDANFSSMQLPRAFVYNRLRIADRDGIGHTFLHNNMLCRLIGQARCRVKPESPSRPEGHIYA